MPMDIDPAGNTYRWALITMMCHLYQGVACWSITSSDMDEAPMEGEAITNYCNQRAIIPWIRIPICIEAYTDSHTNRWARHRDWIADMIVDFPRHEITIAVAQPYPGRPDLTPQYQAYLDYCFSVAETIIIEPAPIYSDRPTMYAIYLDVL